MTVPSYVDASTGATDAAGAWTFTCQAAAATGRVFVIHIVQDGSTAAATAVTGTTNINNLAGAAGVTTIRSDHSLSSMRIFIFIGRSTSTSAPTISGSNSTSEDLYFRAYQFADVSLGTTLATVVENTAASPTSFTSGAISPANDSIVTTAGSDRLALNLVSVNDDVTFAGFTGETGGTWTTRASYAESSGTDAALYLTSAPMTAAGSIDGGSGALGANVGWATHGFALMPVEVSRVPRHPAINHQNPGLLMEHVKRNWNRLRSGLVVPDREIWTPA